MTFIEGVTQSPSNGRVSAAEMTQSPDAHAACRFYVQVGEKSSLIQAVFNELSGLQVEMQVTEYEEGGINSFIHKMPGRLKVGNITLKHGLTKSNEFMKWCMAPKIQRRNVTVVMYDVAGKTVVRWNFLGAFPVKWSGPQFTADSTAVAIESIELAHQGVTIDPP